VGFSFLGVQTMNDAKRSAGKVYLIGAGPGDPKLLTIRAAEALRESDVIVYDYLVNPEVLVHSRRDALLIYAGKRAGELSISQSQLNGLLVEHAQEGKVVARLKGGDPFIFGRGGEEAEALVSAGIEWEIVPGISSGVAAAAYAGIPLTHRNHSSSVAFVTGHDGRDNNKQPVDWPAMARAADTLVIFMCAETIASIARILIENGRAQSTPIAIVRWGTYQHQEVYSGSLADLIAFDDYTGFRIESPAIAIVGEVAALGAKLKWFGSDESRFELAKTPCENRIYEPAQGESYVATVE
jgi:uroporphyrin-III C-methyltransferase